MRAVFQQKEAAALVGIPISQTYRFTFALGTTLAALSGILLGAVFVVHPTAAELATLKAFVVVILGGMGSFGGAIVGGLLLGVVESLGGGFISTGYKIERESCRERVCQYVSYLVVASSLTKK